ncbi:MFS transporter [Streptomyces sp. NPDC050856]|uniref:MFS transporter n=1 Tax=Streptomyces sp. NPDC050856 TaxID=3154939 RepID=UPI0033F85A48
MVAGAGRALIRRRAAAHRGGGPAGVPPAPQPVRTAAFVRPSINAEAPQHRLGATPALLAFAQLIISIDYNIVHVALPEVGSNLGFSAQNLRWVVSAYAVAFGGVLLLGGRVSDLFGPRRMCAVGLGLYAVSSLLGGLAEAPGVLVAARAVQSVGGTCLFPATLTLVPRASPKDAGATGRSPCGARQVAAGSFPVPCSGVC